MKSLKKIGVFVLAVITANTIYAQSKTAEGYTKLPNGLEYKMKYDAPGAVKPKVDDQLKVHIRMSLDDSLMMDSKKDNGGNPVEFALTEPMYDGDFISALMLFTPGDSGSVAVPLDKLLAEMKKKDPNMQLPPNFNNKKYLRYDVQLVSVKTAEEMQKERDAAIAPQLAKDDILLKEYFSKNKLQPKKTASGLYYRVTTEGTGETIKKGQTAQMKYIGTTLDGKVFDANMGAEAKRTEALPVPVGKGQVIRGWDEGLQLLKKGSKATFYIPSPLAYGTQAMGEMIPANSVLIFDVEVEDVK